jgi:membrane-associated protein
MSLDPVVIISAVGLLGIFAIVFAETGLFFGFFLPGDSLLLTAGIIASQGLFSFPLLVVGCIVCAILGDTVGYWFGRKVGPKIFTKEDSFFFRKKHIETTRDFYEKYGVRTIIIARLVPIVRTFAPILAGVAEMNYRTFMMYNIIGGVSWVIIFTGAGYLLGDVIGKNTTIIGWIVGAIIFFSVIPIIKEIISRDKKKKDKGVN